MLFSTARIISRQRDHQSPTQRCGTRPPSRGCGVHKSSKRNEQNVLVVLIVSVPTPPLPPAVCVQTCSRCCCCVFVWGSTLLTYFMLVRNKSFRTGTSQIVLVCAYILSFYCRETKHGEKPGTLARSLARSLARGFGCVHERVRGAQLVSRVLVLIAAAVRLLCV